MAERPSKYLSTNQGKLSLVRPFLIDQCRYMSNFNSQIEALYLRAIKLQERSVQEIRNDEQLIIPQDIDYLSFVSIPFFISTLILEYSILF